MAAAVLYIGELAALLGVSRRTIERERRSGRFPIPGIRVGRRWAFARVAVERYIHNVGAGRREVHS